MAYLAGICAKHIPENPGIVTNVPTTIILTPFPAPPNPSNQNSPAQGPPAGQPAVPGQTPAPGAANPAGPPAAAAPAAPYTVIPVSTTVTLPCPSGASMGSVSQLPDGQPQAAGQTLTQTTPESCTTTSVLQTQVTVPQVAFTTSGSDVGLVAGTAPPPGETPPSQPPTEAGAVGSNTPIAPTSTGVTPFTGGAAKPERSAIIISFVLAAFGLAYLA